MITTMITIIITTIITITMTTRQRQTGRSLLAIGISGGLVPCPSALVLLLSAIALHQITYGLVLVGGFSLGLASVLTTLGLAAVYGKQWLEKSPFGAGVMQRLSVVSAFATVCIGIGLTMVSLRAGGLG
jgi:nickel/cobalt exporter